MPNSRSHGAFRKMLMVILCGCLALQSGCVPVSVHLTQASNGPLQNADADSAPAQEKTASVAQPASPVNVSPATDTDRSSFTDTKIGSQSRPVPPPTLSGLPDPSATQSVPLSSMSNQASSTAQAGVVLLPGWNLISIPDLITDTIPATGLYLSSIEAESTFFRAGASEVGCCRMSVLGRDVVSTRRVGLTRMD